MQDLTVALLQSELQWHNPDANRQHFSQQIAALKQPVDLVVLPEMFTTGFTMDAAGQAEPNEPKNLNWLKGQAKKFDTAIIGSIATNTDGNCTNRLYFVQPNGHFSTYDKRHLFAMAGEHNNYQAGSKRLIVEYKSWRICPLICYDLRFPVWSRNQPLSHHNEALNQNHKQGQTDYDLLLYIANWPNKRRLHWRKLLQARAIENQSYCIGVNRIGIDGNGLEYAGDSMVCDSLGEIVADATDKACALIHLLNAEHLQTTRSQLPFLQDADQFIIHDEHTR